MAEIIKSKIINYPHGFSTRIGGVSSGIYSSLNLGMNRDDLKENVIKNWYIFLNECGIDKKEFVCGKQIHENYVHICTKENAHPPYEQPTLIEADGYVTNEANVPLAIFTADCTPLLLADETNGVIAAIHCGWRSTVSDIEKNAIDAMLSLGASLDKIKASTGPSIGPCHFEVGGEVIDAVDSLLGYHPDSLITYSKNPGKFMLNLPGVVKERLLSLGLLSENIEIINECTLCNLDKYWSHRSGGFRRGSQANAIMIK